MNITLIGMPGSGKTSIGREVARILGYDFVDIDQLVRKKAGLPLQDIIDTKGDEALVQLEEKVVLGLSIGDGIVISPGGSIVYSDKAMDRLKERTIIIFLHTPLSRVKQQINNQDSRGIVGLKGRSFEKLFAERFPLYQKYADMSIDIGDRDTVSSVAAKIVEAIRYAPEK
ncbi:MAG: shikimate kinase [Methanomethylovorans sp. PtaU1.Bin093]|jgi:shikimate kinase|uniref:shikimate kinase n=1 Tax=Methanomethylovorans sp. PtaU1.Bin093 TaxID=1811679 RepID=UPI0009CA059D|nr:shikimate kinase [Methanomethylovorans sp. PtaU1.Bin093]OPY20050.1 MAG: shikimate kinase [Methanomethylovorans sp. PtaU1.Bin093]